MNFLPDTYYVVTALAAIAALLLSYEFMRIITFKRAKTSLVYAVPLTLLALACLRVQQMESNQRYTEWQRCAQYLTDALLFISVAVIPAVRKRTYVRPGFEAIKATHKELRHSNLLFGAFMDRAPVLAWIKDAQQRFIYVNRFFEQRFGTSRDQLSGQKDIEWESQEGKKRVLAVERQVLQTKQRQEYTEDLIVGGDKHTVWAIIFPLEGLRARSMVGGIAADITGNLERKRRTDHLARIIECSPDPIYTYDEEGIVQTWNPAAERLYGYAANEIIGKSVDIIVPRAEASGSVSALWKGLKALSGQPLENIETVRRAKDGSLIDVSLSATRIPTYERHRSNCAIIARDLRPIKSAHARIKLLNAELELRLSELASINKNLQRATEQAIQSAQIKSNFVANISHELRTPLSGILGMSEFLVMEELGPNDAPFATMIYQSAKALLNTVNEVLDLCKLEAGKASLDTEPFNPVMLAEETMKLLSPAATAKQLAQRLRFDDSVPLSVYADSAKIRQVLLSLIGNAVKFTTTGGVTVKVSVSDSDESTVKLKFAIADTGPGISAEDGKLIFTPLAKVGHGQQTSGGAALGLAVGKRLVQLMSGTIGFTSEPGKGSEFWFEIPCRLTPLSTDQLKPAAAPLSATTAKELEKHTVLSVEDDPILSRLTLKQLDALGIRCESADTGKGAIQKIIAGRCDAILLDMHLSDMTGCELAKRVRELEQQKRLPRHTIIALTASGTSEDRAEAERCGIDDYLVKPVSLESLRNTLYRWLTAPPASET